MSSAQMVNHAPTDTSTSGLLSLVVAPDGGVASVTGRWAGVGRPSVASLFDFVHADDHDAVRHALGWVVDHGLVAHGMPVDVRGPGGWAAAILAVELDPDGVRCTFVPVAADPLAGVAADLVEDRRIDVVVDRAIRTFAATCPAIWVSVHSGPDAERRRRRVAGTFGHEGFGSAVAAAAAGAAPTPWDEPIAEEPAAVDLSSLPDGLQLASSHVGVRSCVAIPVPSLAGDDAAVLMTWCDHAERLADPTAAVALDRLVDALRLAYAMASMHATIRHVSTHDELTGLWNRSALHARLDTLAAPARSAVVCLDLDSFATVNSRHGILAGDTVLVELARRLREVIRPGDMLARTDGDDFVLVCADIAGEDEATGIAERVIAATYQPFHVAGTPTPVRASVGLAVGRAGSTGRELFERAARTLAEVKMRAPGTWAIG